MSRRNNKKIGFCKRFAIFMRDEFVCVFCGKFSYPTQLYRNGRKNPLAINTILPKQLLKAEYSYKSILTLDHIIAISNGGDDSPFNLVTACRHCNMNKGDKTWADLASSKQQDIAQAISRDYSGCYKYIHKQVTSGKRGSKLHIIHRHNQLIQAWRKNKQMSFLQYVKEIHCDQQPSK